MRSFVVLSHGLGRNYSRNLVAHSGTDPTYWSSVTSCFVAMRERLGRMTVTRLEIDSARIV